MDVAGNGLEALAMLNKLNPLPSIIFMDVNMPYMDGLDCLRYIKAAERFKSIPVVMLTTTNNAKEKEASGTLGASLFLTKPTIYTELKQHLSKVLQGIF